MCPLLLCHGVFCTQLLVTIDLQLLKSSISLLLFYLLCAIESQLVNSSILIKILSPLNYAKVCFVYFRGLMLDAYILHLYTF